MDFNNTRSNFESKKLLFEIGWDNFVLLIERKARWVLQR